MIVKALSVAIPVMLSVLVGCGGAYSAQVVTRDATRVEGQIVSADESHVYIEDADDHRIHAVAREDIVRLSHPGKTSALVGLGVAGAGAALTTLGAIVLASEENPDREECESFCSESASDLAAGVALSIGAGALITGVILSITGFDTYSTSEERARGERRMRLQPTLSLQGNGGTLGISGEF